MRLCPHFHRHPGLVPGSRQKAGMTIVALLALSGCSWIGRQADALGEHMPVIGERCEHWQCMTTSGQARSEAIKRQQAEEARKKDAIPPAEAPAPAAEETPTFPSQPRH